MAKAELLGKCQINRKLDNDFSGILEYLDRLVRADRLKQHPFRSHLRRRSWTLRRTLAGVHFRLEGKAVKKQPGLAGILYMELSGDAGLAIFRRLDAACQLLLIARGQIPWRGLEAHFDQ